MPSLFQFGFKKMPKKLDDDGGVRPEAVPKLSRAAVLKANELLSNAKPLKGKRGKYKSSNAEFRLKAAEYCRLNGLKAAHNKYVISKSTLSGWRDKYIKVMICMSDTYLLHSYKYRIWILYSLHT